MTVHQNAKRTAASNGYTAAVICHQRAKRAGHGRKIANRAKSPNRMIQRCSKLRPDVQLSELGEGFGTLNVVHFGSTFGAGFGSVTFGPLVSIRACSSSQSISGDTMPRR